MIYNKIPIYVLITGNYQILKFFFELFLDKKNMSSYLGPLVHTLI